jgi:hypothetical protein
VVAGPFGSTDVAVSPTVEPLAAPSATELAAGLLSVGTGGATSVTAMVKLCVLDSVPSLALAVTV